MTAKRNHIDDLRGASKLAVEATRGVTDLVQAMHETIASGPAILGKPLEGPVKLLNQLVYGSIRQVTEVVGAGIDVALGQLAPILGDGEPGPEREAVLAVLNGVLGDYLHETHNPLAIQMSLKHEGRPLALEPAALRAAFPDASGKLLILVHGSSMNDRQWSRKGHDHGAALARELGYQPLYVHYNSGLHVSTNGRELASLLEALVAAWPTAVTELVLLGHSMGGLVARSACRVGEVSRQAWRGKLRALVTLGAPHHGAALERGGNLVQLLIGVSRYSAPLARLAKIRSAGVTDLRFGSVVDEDWQGRDRFAVGEDPRTMCALPRGVACYAVAATFSPKSGAKLAGDGLVSVDSALGRHPKLDLAFPEGNCAIVHGAGHLDLLDRSEVLEQLVRWLKPS